MDLQRLSAVFLLFSATLLSMTVQSQSAGPASAGPAAAGGNVVTISNPGISLVLDYGNKASITSLVVNGQKVIGSEDGIFSSLTADGSTYSSLHLRSTPVLTRNNGSYTLSGIRYGDARLTILENWIFTINDRSIKWDIERSLSKPVRVEEAATPVINFDKTDTWEGAYQGYGGVAWFYLFNEDLCTYGVHTHSADFWNSNTGNGLTIAVDAAGQKVAMKYTRTREKRLACAITISDKEKIGRAHV